MKKRFGLIVAIEMKAVSDGLADGAAGFYAELKKRFTEMPDCGRYDNRGSC